MDEYKELNDKLSKKTEIATTKQSKKKTISKEVEETNNQIIETPKKESVQKIELEEVAEIENLEALKSDTKMSCEELDIPNSAKKISTKKSSAQKSASKKMNSEKKLSTKKITPEITPSKIRPFKTNLDTIKEAIASYKKDELIKDRHLSAFIKEHHEKLSQMTRDYGYVFHIFSDVKSETILEWIEIFSTYKIDFEEKDRLEVALSFRDTLLALYFGVQKNDQIEIGSHVVAQKIVEEIMNNEIRFVAEKDMSEITELFKKSQD